MLNMRITRRGTPGDFLAPIMLNLSKRKAAMAFPAVEGMAPLPFTSEVRARTDGIYERMKGVIPAVEWPLFAPEIDAILRLKRERNAIVLAHNYQTPEIFHGVADIVGDSLALARRDRKSVVSGKSVSVRVDLGGAR